MPRRPEAPGTASHQETSPPRPPAPPAASRSQAPRATARSQAARSQSARPQAAPSQAARSQAAPSQAAPPRTPRPRAPRTTSSEDLVEALLSASRAMVAMAGRSLAGLDAEVTLPQYRALVVLASRGPQRVVDISGELGVNPSTGTRMCDRLTRKGLVRRYRSTTDRREVRLSLTPAGKRLVEQVVERRRDELTRLVDTMPHSWHRPVTLALRSLSETVGEVPEREWWLGWGDGEDLTP